MLKDLFNFNNEDIEKFKIILKGQYQRDEENKILDIKMTKEDIQGEGFFLMYTLIYYASLIALDSNDNMKRQDFLDLANAAYMNAVKEM